MNDERDLAAIVDRCLDDLAAGRATVADCLARHPAQRAALEPLLTAAAALARVPRPAERAPDAARRAALMAQIRTLPQQRPLRRWALPALPAWPALRGGLLPRLMTATAPVAVAMVLGVLLLASQRATPAAAASTLTLFGGSAERQLNGAWAPLADGAQLGAGSRLRTGADGHALLTFPDGSTATLDPGTEISIEQLAAAGPRVVRLHQYSGRLWHDVATDLRTGAAYAVRTADASVEVHGTVFETTVVGGETAVSTAEGNVDVITGAQRVTVPPGQQLRTRAQQVAARTAIPSGGSLTVAAPFTAALVAPSGEATGARPDGATFRQIRGVTTSDPGDGPQRFDFQRLEPGLYTLLLQRLGSGDGDLVLDDDDGAEHRVSIDAQAGTARVQVRVVLRDGVPSIELLGDAAEHVPAAPDPVRVVETPRTRKSEDVAAQRERKDREREDREQAQPAAPARLIDPAVERFAQQLRSAVNGNDAGALRDRLSEILAPADVPTVQARLAVLAALVAEDSALNRVARALSGDANATLRTRLLQAADSLAPAEARARLRLALSGEPGRAPTATSTRSPRSEATTTPTSITNEAATTAFRRALGDALDREDAGAIREQLAALLASPDAQSERVRLDVLAALLADDEDAAGRVTRALSADAHTALRTQLLQAVETIAAPEARAALRRTLLGEPTRGPLLTPRAEPPRTPTPSRSEALRTPRAVEGRDGAD